MNDIRKNLISNILNSFGFSIIAGPCVIESRDNMLEIADALSNLGVKYIRGGAYKMRTSPDSYRGLGSKALEFLYDAGEKYDLITVSECTDINHVVMMSELVDILLIGTRNMSNYPLLEKMGSITNPVVLKRGMCATYKEWLLAASYIEKSGNLNIVLCERGIRTFEPYTRNTLDITSIPVIKSISQHPIIADPSHSSGRRDLVKSLSWAAVAAGANGLMIETHSNPDTSSCDSEQSITLKQLEIILKPLDLIRELVN
jgi:3-deoxy-7-phosphoheptulonate synthase